jgi:hypothetical protein
VNVKDGMEEYQILQDILAVRDILTRKKMSLIIEIEMFDPKNPKVVSLLSKFSIEDIELVIYFVKINKTDNLQWHDGKQICVSMAKNDIPGRLKFTKISKIVGVQSRSLCNDRT